MSADPLTYDDGPLVWVDCEMTGLDFLNDRIIEIAVIITDGRLRPVDAGISYVIMTPKDVLDGMGEWCLNQHGKTGLIDSCLSSPHSYEDVTKLVLDYIQRWIPERGAGLLAGSTVHADMRFLLLGMPEVMKHLSYRIVDVSSVKEICKRWYPSIRAREQESRTEEISHRCVRVPLHPVSCSVRALDDIRASIRELQFYRDTIFKPLELEPESEPSAKLSGGETGEGEEKSAAPIIERKTAL